MCLTFVSTNFAMINNDWTIKFTESFRIDIRVFDRHFEHHSGITTPNLGTMARRFRNNG